MIGVVGEVKVFLGVFAFLDKIIIKVIIYVNVVYSDLKYIYTV